MMRFVDRLMPGSIETARISGDNIDAALALLQTVVPPRPSLRRALEAPGSEKLPSVFGSVA